jgi:pseudouridine synthase
MRINKFLAKAGIASRRSADILVEQGRVAVNGHKVIQLGVQVDENRDEVTFDGKPVRISPRLIYLMLHKPASCLVTSRDEFGRPTVIDLVREYGKKVKPVGRLDFNSSGLLLLTNDGELAFRLTHPRFHIDKIYQVKCEHLLSDDQISRLESGVELDDELTAPARVELVSRSPGFSQFRITIHEGRKRQVRRMCQAVGSKVLALKRIAFGALLLGDLRVGTFRHLTDKEIAMLKGSVGL